MTTTALIEWLRHMAHWFNDDSFIRKNLAEAADRLGELDERVAIMAESAEPIRCGECKQWDEEGSYMGRGWCGYQMKSTGPRYFCASAEPKEDERNDRAGTD